MTTFNLNIILKSCSIRPHSKRCLDELTKCHKYLRWGIEPAAYFSMSSKNTMQQNVSTRSSSKVITEDNMNPLIKVMEYAVRGPIVIRANGIQKELAMGVKKDFDQVILANIGDAHAMGQKPITFIRQLVSLCSYPELLKENIFPDDVKEKARRLLKECKGGSAGSYSHSLGIEIIRRDVADYIEKRDGHPCDFNDIILCAGASEGIRSFLTLICNEENGQKPGVMIPIPQYPLYSATLAEFGVHPINYYLNEENHWSLDISELKRALDENRKLCNPKVIVVINPGNPTGQVLKKDNVEAIIQFAHQENLVILADEVYQHNIYDKDSQFHSFKKIMKDMGEPYSHMELASFMSTSKGYMGECGLRGGYGEMINLNPVVVEMLQKSVSARLCPTVLGQITMDAVVNPPVKGDKSFEEFSKEQRDVLKSLAERAELTAKILNSIEGMSCNPVQGAMYAFPKITIPPKAIQKANSLNQAPDFFWAMQLLESTGICVVPGSGFGQKPDTYHFRTTILPQPDLLKVMLDKIKQFHTRFTKEFS